MIACSIVILLAALSGEHPTHTVVWPDGTVALDAAVACPGDCWAAVPGAAPQRVEPGDSGLVLQPVPAARLLVLDELSGAPITAGTVRWLDPEVPEDLAVFQWSAEAGRLDLAAPAGTEIEISAPDQRPQALVLSVEPGRRTVALTAVRDLEVVVTPPAEGTVFLGALSRTSPFSPLPEVGVSADLIAGRARFSDLRAGETWIGAVLPRHLAPTRLPVGDLPARIEIALEEGLVLVGGVRDEDQRPLDGARVSATGHIESLDGLRYSQVATADEDGRFRLSGLLAGEIKLEACAPKHACERATVVLAPEACPGSHDFVLEPGFDLVLEFVDQYGIALPGVSVKALGAFRESDDRGFVTVPGVAHGDRLALSARGGGVVPWMGKITVASSRQRVELQRGAMVRWPLRVPEDLARDVGVSWKRVRPEDWQPLGEGEGRWDAGQGEAVAEGLLPGVVRLLVDVPGFATLGSESVELGEGELVVLPAGAPDLGGTLIGRVVGSANAVPIAGATITCEAGGPTAFRSPAERSDARSAVSDESGTFLVAGLGDGTYRVRAVAPGFAPTVLDGVEPGTDIGDIELDVGLVVEGHVVDRRGSPVVGIMVEAWEPAPYVYAPEKQTLTDMNGAFRMEGLPVGEWRLEVETGGRTARRTIVGSDGDIVSVELRIGGTQVVGTVFVGDRPGGPGSLVLEPPGQPSGPVVLLDRDARRRFFGLSGPVSRAGVDSDGSFELPSIDPGLWTARFTTASGVTPATTDLLIPDVERHACILRFPGGTLLGTVVDEDDQPVGGARIDLVAGTRERVAFADPSGSFTFAGVGPGLVTLTAWSQGYGLSDPVTVEIRDQRDPDPVVLLLRADTGGRIEVTISTEAGSLSGAPAVLIGPSGGTRLLGPEGRAIWDNVDPGSYRVCARAYGGPVGCTPPTFLDEEPKSLFLDLGRGGFVSVRLPDGATGRPVPRVTCADGTDITGLALLGNMPPVVDDVLFLGPFASGTYGVAVRVSQAEVSGTVNVADGEITELRR